MPLQSPSTFVQQRYMCCKEGSFLGLQEMHKINVFLTCSKSFFFLFFLFLGLQGQHIILCASGNSSKFSGIHSFQECLFLFAAVLFTGFSGFTARLVLCLVRYVYRLPRTNDLRIYRCIERTWQKKKWQCKEKRKIVKKKIILLDINKLNVTVFLQMDYA